MKQSESGPKSAVKLRSNASLFMKRHTLAHEFMSPFVTVWLGEIVVRRARHHNITRFVVYQIIFGLVLFWFFWPK